MKPTPIRVGDKFACINGRTWEVFEVYPGGKLDLVSRDGGRVLAATMYHREVRQWTRMEAQ